MGQRDKLLGRAGPLVLARLATAAISTAIPLVLARAMDLAEYGSYKQIFLITQTLFLVLPFGMVQSLYFFAPRSSARRPLYSSAFACLALSSVVAVALVYGGGAAAAHYFENPDLLRYRAVIAVYLVGMLGSAPLEIALTSEGKTSQAAVVYLVSDTLKAAVMVLPIVLGRGLAGVMQALAAFTLVRLVATVWLLLRGSEGPLWSTAALKEQAHYALPFGASVLLARPTSYAHQYAVSAAVGPSLFGLYSVGCFQLPVVDLLYTPTTEVLMVQLGELERAGRMDEAAGAFRAAASRLAFFFLPLAALLFLCAPEFIAALFGPRFLAAVPVFRVSVLGILMSVLPIDGALRSRNLTRHIFLGAVAKAALMLPMAFFAVARFGMMGGIVSWVAGELFGKAVLFYKVPVALAAPGQRLRFREVVPWRALGQAAGATVLGVVGGLAAKAGLVATGLGAEGGFWLRLIPLALVGGAFAAGYLAGLPLVGVRPLAMLRRPRAVPVAGVA